MTKCSDCGENGKDKNDETQKLLSSLMHNAKTSHWRTIVIFGSILIIMSYFLPLFRGQLSFVTFTVSGHQMATGTLSTILGDIYVYEGSWIFIIPLILGLLSLFISPTKELIWLLPVLGSTTVVMYVLTYNSVIYHMKEYEFTYLGYDYGIIIGILGGVIVTIGSIILMQCDEA